MLIFFLFLNSEDSYTSANINVFLLLNNGRVDVLPPKLIRALYNEENNEIKPGNCAPNEKLAGIFGHATYCFFNNSIVRQTMFVFSRIIAMRIFYTRASRLGLRTSSIWPFVYYVLSVLRQFDAMCHNTLSAYAQKDAIQPASGAVFATASNFNL